MKQHPTINRIINILKRAFDLETLETLENAVVIRLPDRTFRSREEVAKLTTTAETKRKRRRLRNQRL